MIPMAGGVKLTDETSIEPVTSKLCIYINNKPITNMSLMYKNSRAKSIDFSSFNTSNVTKMHRMFEDSQVDTLDLSNFDTSKVTDMSWMFYRNLATTIDLSNFDTSNVTTMDSMFAGSSVTMLDVSRFNTIKVTDMTQMFYGFKGTSLDLSNFDTNKVTKMSGMFEYSKNLKTIYASNKFVTTSVVSGYDNDMFNNCTHLVGGNGTKYSDTYIGKTYARIDTPSTPGYFTLKQ